MGLSRASIVESRGFRPVLAEHGEKALEIVQHEPVHLALLDMNMPRLTGLETLQLVRQIYAALPAQCQQFLSMGMTGDFETAIAEGATHVRIGTAIFGLIFQ